MLDTKLRTIYSLTCEYQGPGKCTTWKRKIWENYWHRMETLKEFTARINAQIEHNKLSSDVYSEYLHQINKEEYRRNFIEKFKNDNSMFKDSIIDYQYITFYVGNLSNEEYKQTILSQIENNPNYLIHMADFHYFYDNTLFPKAAILIYRFRKRISAIIATTFNKFVNNGELKWPIK